MNNRNVVAAAAVAVLLIASGCSAQQESSQPDSGDASSNRSSSSTGPQASGNQASGTQIPETQVPGTQTPDAAASSLTISGVGDVIMGSTPTLPPNGGASFFDDVRDSLHGDVVLGNFDSTMTTRTASSKCGADSSNCYAFRVPPDYGKWLNQAGFTDMNLANNHTRDYGESGLQDTAAAMRDHDIRPTGMPGQIAMGTHNGVKVAVVGFAPYSWTQSLLDIPAAKKLVAAAEEKADVVVVAMHAGGEGADQQHVTPGTERSLGENRGDPIGFSHAVIDAGADLVVGSGPHVLRGMEWYEGRLIAYSMGNFAGYEVLSIDGPLGVGGVLSVTMRGDGSFASGELVGTRLDGSGLPTSDPQNRGVALVRQLTETDFPDCGAQMSVTGTLQAPTC